MEGSAVSTRSNSNEADRGSSHSKLMYILSDIGYQPANHGILSDFSWHPGPSGPWACSLLDWGSSLQRAVSSGTYRTSACRRAGVLSLEEVLGNCMYIVYTYVYMCVFNMMVDATLYGSGIVIYFLILAFKEFICCFQLVKMYWTS